MKNAGTAPLCVGPETGNCGVSAISSALVLFKRQKGALLLGLQHPTWPHTGDRGSDKSWADKTPQWGHWLIFIDLFFIFVLVAVVIRYHRLIQIRPVMGWLLDSCSLCSVLYINNTLILINITGECFCYLVWTKEGWIIKSWLHWHAWPAYLSLDPHFL